MGWSGMSKMASPLCLELWQEWMSSCAYLGLTRSVYTHGLSSKLFLVQFSFFHGDWGLHRECPMTQAVKADGFLNPGPRNWCGVTSAISSPCLSSVQFSSTAQSCPTLCDPMNHSMIGPPCPPPTPGVHSNSCPSSKWCHPAISSSVVPFSSCPQSLPASGSFPMSQLFAWGSQSIGVSASTSVLPMNTQGWFPLEWTGWISLQSKGLSRVFSNTKVQKHQFFGTQLSSQSNSHIHTRPLEKP